MIHTVAHIILGATMLTAPVQSLETTTSTIQSPQMEECGNYGDKQVVSHNLSVNSTTEELETIRLSAEEAGMKFTYKKRGVKTRLVIDMVFDTEEDYEMKRLVLRAEDGIQTVSWKVNEKGQAVAFLGEEDDSLTQHSK